MTDRIEKFLTKLNKKESETYRDIVKAILSNNFDMYDVKKMSGYSNIFRIRKGRLRIIFKKDNEGNEILHVGNRDENTYRNY